LHLKLERFEFTEKSTIGKLFIDGKFECYTLEDTDRHLENDGIKIYGETCIPRCSNYKVIIDYSNHFKKRLPHILNVRNFTGIRIHKGNKPENTEGCILVGTSYTNDWISSSKKAFDPLFEKIENALKKGNTIQLEIT